MSLKMPSAPNAGLFKQGYHTYQSEDGVVNRNIAAVREITDIVRTSVGPCGRNKIIVNHLDKVYLTSDAGTILRELDIIHPAVKIVVMAAEQQEMEMGDASSLVVVLCGELLNKAEELLRIGMATSEIIQGYELSLKHALGALDELATSMVDDLGNVDQLATALRPVIAPKQYGFETILAKLVAEAVAYVMPRTRALFNVDNVRVVKIMGASIGASKVIKGMVFNREAEGAVKHVKATKVAIFTCPVDILTTETKGTVLLHNAQEMIDFSKGEEKQMDARVRELADKGVGVIIAGGGLGQLATHYFNRYGILAFKLSSKFDLQRLCRVTGASPLPKFSVPGTEALGFIDSIECVEIGGDRCTVFRQDLAETRTSTIVLRGATQNFLDDIERAIDDGVNSVKALTRDTAVVPGAGATEIAIAASVSEQGERTAGTLQHAVHRYASALEIIPRTLAENAGLDGSSVISALYSAHARGETAGVDVEGESITVDARASGLYDIKIAKASAIRQATEAACTLLSVDQIIMAKRAGGPTLPKKGGDWDQD